MTVFAGVGAFQYQDWRDNFRGLAHDTALLVGGDWEEGVNAARYLNR